MTVGRCVLHSLAPPLPTHLPRETSAPKLSLPPPFICAASTRRSFLLPHLPSPPLRSPSSFHFLSPLPLPPLPQGTLERTDRPTCERYNEKVSRSEKTALPFPHPRSFASIEASARRATAGQGNAQTNPPPRGASYMEKMHVMCFRVQTFVHKSARQRKRSCSDGRHVARMLHVICRCLDARFTGHLAL